MYLYSVTIHEHVQLYYGTKVVQPEYDLVQLYMQYAPMPMSMSNVACCMYSTSQELVD